MPLVANHGYIGLCLHVFVEMSSIVVETILLVEIWRILPYLVKILQELIKILLD